MLENVDQFISVHNANVALPELTATMTKISAFVLEKNIALSDLSIEKHRMPFINWCTSLSNAPI
ncbi:MAG TPA: hypothetical protein VLE47_03865 [Candidatus Saccharimonadales bacterium]|nr:hypothetical protein [Candidatus Saccharimonadales bacterium]